MAAIEAVLKITRWGKNLASSAYSTLIILPKNTNRNNGPQLDAKLVPQSTFPDDRDSCFRCSLRKEQTAMLQRPLSDEPVPKFAQRATRILINEKRESLPNLKGLEQMYRNKNCPSVPPDDIISVDGPRATFAFMFQKLATTCVMCTGLREYTV